jgi:hypothetical protein
VVSTRQRVVCAQAQARRSCAGLQVHLLSKISWTISKRLWVALIYELWHALIGCPRTRATEVKTHLTERIPSRALIRQLDPSGTPPKRSQTQTAHRLPSLNPPNSRHFYMKKHIPTSSSSSSIRGVPPPPPLSPRSLIFSSSLASSRAQWTIVELLVEYKHEGIDSDHQRKDGDLGRWLI